MTAISFETPAELATYVDDNAITNADIASILERAGRWWIFHF